MNDFTCYHCSEPKSILEFGDELTTYDGRLVMICDECLDDLMARQAARDVMDSSFDFR